MWDAGRTKLEEKSVGRRMREKEFGKKNEGEEGVRKKLGRWGIGLKTEGGGGVGRMRWK